VAAVVTANDAMSDVKAWGTVSPHPPAFTVNVVDDEMGTLADRWACAEVNSDVGALDVLLAEGFCGIGPLGYVLDKAAWLGRFAGGLNNAAVTFSDLHLRDYGDSVVVVGVLDQEATFKGGEASGRYRVSFVVVRASGRWQIASCHIGSLDGRREES
jgi:ketosteroid isomerase-like protein